MRSLGQKKEFNKDLRRLVLTKLVGFSVRKICR
jgi:hypothetical protein